MPDEQKKCIKQLSEFQISDQFQYISLGWRFIENGLYCEAMNVFITTHVVIIKIPRLKNSQILKKNVENPWPAGHWLTISGVVIVPSAIMVMCL